MRSLSFAILVTSILPASALADSPKRAKPLDVRSPAFSQNGAIPSEYTCDGAELSPPLSWSTVPTGTKSIAIFVDDPDAPKGKFTHWLVTGIPASTTSLDKGVALPEGAVASKNDKGLAGYAGPCPPAGRHRYVFRVYALDVAIPRGVSRSELLNVVTRHVLATGQLVGTYQKQGSR